MAFSGPREQERAHIHILSRRDNPEIFEFRVKFPGEEAAKGRQLTDKRIRVHQIRLNEEKRPLPDLLVAFFTMMVLL